MIKFFRHIRQRMIRENRVSKPALPAGRYLLYAIGEIVLVVIGILIALQLNEWKSDLADRKMERSHIESFREDLRNQLQIIDTQIAFENQYMLKADSALSFFNGELSLAQLEATMDVVGHRKTFVQSKASFEELLSTGGLRLIRNQDVRKEMMNYHQRLDYTTKVINTNNGLVDEIFNTPSSSHVAIFSIDKNGDLDTTVALSGQDLYRIKQSLNIRSGLTRIAIDYCNTQRIATIDLIAKMDTMLIQ